MCADLNLPLLGKVPLDPRIARSCDEGRSFLNDVPDSPAAAVYQTIVRSEFFHGSAHKDPVVAHCGCSGIVFEGLLHFRERKLSSARPNI